MLNLNLWKIVAFLAGLLAVLVFFTGCASLNASPPIEAFANKFTDEVVKPAITEGLKQGIQATAVQFGAQGINPTYKVKFSGKWVTGIEGEASIGAEGIAGQVQTASLGSDRTTKSPYLKLEDKKAAAGAASTATSAPASAAVSPDVEAKLTQHSSQIGELSNEIADLKAGQSAIVDALNNLAARLPAPTQ